MDVSFKKVFTDFQKYLKDNSFDNELLNKNSAKERNVIKNIIKLNLDVSKISSKDETLLDDQIFPNLSLRDLYNQVEDKSQFWKVLQLFVIVKDEEDEEVNENENEQEKIKLSNMFDDITDDAIKEASETVKKQLGESGENNMMTEMLDEIGEQLRGGENKNIEMTEQEKKQAELFSSMFNIDSGDMANIMGIARNVTNKFKSKIENDDMNPEELLGSAQSLMANMGGGNNPMLNTLLQGMGAPPATNAGGRARRNRKKKVTTKPQLGL